MELPNPDPLTGRPEHGGRDRHVCIAIRDVSKLKEILDKAGNQKTQAKEIKKGFKRHFSSLYHTGFLIVLLKMTGIPYTLSRSGRPAIFFRDPDANALEFTQVDS